MAETGTPEKTERGIGYWMERALAERDKALKTFDADAVHDLRTALRRCRSIAEGFQSLDGNRSWKKMRKAGKAVFSALGDLRDTQVLLEWIERLKSACPPVAERLRTHCLQRETELKQAAAAAVGGFNTRLWLQWARQLESRVHALKEPGEVFEVLALERYDAARELQSRALRNRSKTALHQLRIGIKKFRYIVENFLPQHHARWGKDLKQLQDLLGDVHDLDVLVDTARQVHAFTTPQEKQVFLAAVARERQQRVEAYRSRIVGLNSLWREWRSGLPAGEALAKAVLKRFEVWAGTLDPDLRHTHKVRQFSLQVFDALSAAGLTPQRNPGAVKLRDLLEVAALTHEVGRKRGTRSHHKTSSRLLQKLEVPPAWTRRDLIMAGLVARYHRGSLPDAQRNYAVLPSNDRRCVDHLSGILRLADSLDCTHDSSIRRIWVTHANQIVEIIAEGYRARSKQATQIAAARHLLEDACATPVVVRGSSLRVLRSASSAPARSLETRARVQMLSRHKIQDVR